MFKNRVFKNRVFKKILDLGRRKLHKAGENYIISSFVIHIPSDIPFG